MIWIRADAGKNIGSGHVMRCLSIAAGLQKAGQEICFITADEAPRELLEARGIKYLVLHTAYNRMEEELDVLEPLLSEHRPELLLIDSYHVTEAYFRRVGKYAKTVYMDDIPRFAYAVDGVANYNIYGEDMPYRELYCREKTVHELPRLFLGPAYAPLREQFRESQYKVRSKAEHVLITTGGSDRYNLAGKILQEVLGREKLQDLHYHVVSGAFNPHLGELEKLAAHYGGIQIYRNVSDMAGLMKQCDMAITAGGSTMYELSAVGIPTLCFSFVDNQELIVENFYRKKLVAYGGNYLKEQERFAGNVADALTFLAGEEALRRRYSDRQRMLVDGKGAERLAEGLCKMIG